MFDSPLVSMLVGYCGVGLVGLASCFIGAAVYDLREAKVRYNFQLHPYSRQHRHRPLISIIIYANNKNQSIMNCLNSIGKNSYHNYEIIIIDDTQLDENLMKNDALVFSARYPKVMLKMLHRRKSSNRSRAVAAGIKKWARGELVMNLDAASWLDKHSLRNLRRHFNSNNEIDALTPAAWMVYQPSLLGLVQQFDQLLRLTATKFISVLKLNNASSDAPGMVYRRKRRSNRTSVQSGRNIKYGSDVLVYCTPAASWWAFVGNHYQRKVQSFYNLKRPKTKKTNINQPGGFKVSWAGRIVLAGLHQIIIILTPFVISYLLYLAIYFKQSALYGLSWLIFSVAVAGIIWSKDQLKARTRLCLTILIPIMYAIFYLTSILQVIIFATIAFKSKLSFAARSQTPAPVD